MTRVSLAQGDPCKDALCHPFVIQTLQTVVTLRQR